MSIVNIPIGWIQYVVNSNKDLVQKRGEICISCSECVHKEYLDWIKDEVKIVEGYVCDECSCPLSAKLRVKKEVCPLGKW